MKIRIFENGRFSSAYDDEFILENQEIISSENWILFDSDEIGFPPQAFFMPFWLNNSWIEGATSQEINSIKQSEIDAIDSDYKERISNLVSPYVQKKVVQGILIPQNILNQMDILVAECSQKIQEIDPTKTMDKPGASNTVK